MPKRKDEEPDFRLRPRKPTRSRTEKTSSVPVCDALREVLRYARASRRATSLANAPKPKPYQQRCAVRLSYAKSKTPGLWKAHGRYLARDSGSRDGGAKQTGFDATDDQIDLSATLNRWQAEGDPRLWKVILSPEFGERLDLMTFTRQWIDQVERETDHRLEWAAVIHTNTDYPHVHVAVRGLDRTGEAVKFAREYVKHGMRDAAQRLCTRELGWRTTQDAELAQQRETTQPHITSLDRVIAKAALDENGDAERFVYSQHELPMKGTLAVRLRLRLNTLVTMGLAEQVGAGDWEVRRDFEAVLRAMKRGRDRQKTLAAHGVALSDDRLPFLSLDLRKLTEVEGRVLVHGEDEVGATAGRPYLLLEGTDGKVHHIPYTDEIHELRRKGQLRVGSRISLRKVWEGGRPTLAVKEVAAAPRRRTDRRPSGPER